MLQTTRYGISHGKSQRTKFLLSVFGNRVSSLLAGVLTARHILGVCPYFNHKQAPAEVAAFLMITTRRIGKLSPLEDRKTLPAQLRKKKFSVSVHGLHQSPFRARRGSGGCAGAASLGRQDWPGPSTIMPTSAVIPASSDTP